MIYTDFKDFVAHIPDKGRLFGIDWGARRTGIAVSDESRGFVFPRGIIREQGTRDKELVKKIIDLMTSENIVGIIVGLPVHVDGTDSDTTAKVREFANALAGQTDVPIGFTEENLTSVEAKEIIDGSRLTACGSRLDSVAAGVILENAIAIIKRLKNV